MERAVMQKQELLQKARKLAKPFGVMPHSRTVSVDWIFQWRENLRDGVYSVPGFLIIPAGKSNARFVGHRPGAQSAVASESAPVVRKPTTEFFYAGRFVKESQPGRNLNFWALWASYKF
jgi:hypothetical protein